MNPCKKERKEKEKRKKNYARKTPAILLI